MGIFDDLNTVLDPDAELLAYKLEAFLKGKDGNAFEPVRLKHSEDRYYY